MISYIIAGVILLYAAFVIVKKLKNKNSCCGGCSGDCSSCRKWLVKGLESR